VESRKHVVNIIGEDTEFDKERSGSALWIGVLENQRYFLSCLGDCFGWWFE
jgi:hypothetical protein